MFNDYFVTHLLLKEFWKMVNIWRSYGQESSVLFVCSTLFCATLYILQLSCGGLVLVTSALRLGPRTSQWSNTNATEFNENCYRTVSFETASDTKNTVQVYSSSYISKQQIPSTNVEDSVGASSRYCAWRHPVKPHEAMMSFWPWNFLQRDSDQRWRSDETIRLCLSTSRIHSRQWLAIKQCNSVDICPPIFSSNVHNKLPVRLA